MAKRPTEPRVTARLYTFATREDRKSQSVAADRAKARELYRQARELLEQAGRQAEALHKQAEELLAPHRPTDSVMFYGLGIADECVRWPDGATAFGRCEECGMCEGIAEVAYKGEGKIYVRREGQTKFEYLRTIGEGLTVGTADGN
jgi:hypothetical protein